MQYRNFYKKLLFWMVLVALPGTAMTQQDSLRLEVKYTIPGAFRFFATDQLQQIYAITEDNAVIKYDAQGVEQFRYNNNTLGELALLDATNPFNLLLYYPDFLTAIILDRTLNKTSDLVIGDLDLALPTQIAMGNDNHIWVYDEADFQLKKLDLRGRLVAKSNNLAFFLGTTPQPTGMSARENRVFLNDPELGVLVFDNFGQYVRTWPLLKVDRFQILDQRIFYQTSQGTAVFHQQSLQTTPLPLSTELTTARQLELQQHRIFALQPSGISVYEIKR